MSQDRPVRRLLRNYDVIGDKVPSAKPQGRRKGTLSRPRWPCEGDGLSAPCDGTGVERLVSRDHGNEREDLADEEALPHVGAGASRSAIDKAAVSGNQVVSPL